MSAAKNHVLIKGNKDGLVFLLDDQCDYADLVRDLRYKLEKTHYNLLRGPIVHVVVKLGKRTVTEEQSEELLSIIRSCGNLIVKKVESDAADDGNSPTRSALHVKKGIVRSGQTLSVDGDLLLVGDVNPGGTVEATGNIYILGALKGMAHAGIGGDEEAVIAASHLRPTQLRIAGVISRPPDEWELAGDMLMEFAYLQDGQMSIDKLIHLHRIRPGAAKFIQGE